MNLEPITDTDKELIVMARQAIIPNYDGVSYNHTVGAAVRCKNGRIYTGVNAYSIHGACAEHVAIGAAITAGEREFEVIVAVEGEKGERILPPCGNCRQMLSDYMPDCMVLIPTEGEIKKVAAKELLPFAYVVQP